MEKLYCLRFYTQPNIDYRECFHIGLFCTCNEAKEIENYYRREIPGFKDYDCDAEITEIQIIGANEKPECVYRYIGWNENDDFDEIDIIESDCYTDFTKAEEDYRAIQCVLERTEWDLERYIIGKCAWQEGFVRVGTN